MLLHNLKWAVDLARTAKMKSNESVKAKKHDG